MAEANPVSANEVTVTEAVTEEAPHSATLHLKLRKPKCDRKVQWTTETVDNEHMNKKKSKCCCIYEKPKVFGESSSEDDDDETGSCHGHKKKCYRHHGNPQHDHDHGGAGPSRGDDPVDGPGPSSS